MKSVAIPLFLLGTALAAPFPAQAAQYKDGAFAGPSVSAYYGMIQIEAVIQNGRIKGIRVLNYPSDRTTSVAINRQALPMLRDELIAAQSGTVNIITGATLTSQAFIRSVSGALKAAAR